MTKAPSPGNQALLSRHGEPIANWCQLTKGDTVDIYSARGTCTTGRIDMLANDGSVLWIIQSEGLGRALFLHEDGFQVRRRTS